jgi:hypothetical protein
MQGRLLCAKIIAAGQLGAKNIQLGHVNEMAGEPADFRLRSLPIYRLHQ